jgi:hypothetical protein
MDVRVLPPQAFAQFPTKKLFKVSNPSDKKLELTLPVLILIGKWI